MNSLTSKETLTSLELVEQINIFRKEEGRKAELQHNDLLKIIRDEFEDEIHEGKISQMFYDLKIGNGATRKSPMYILTLNQAKQVLVRESKYVRKHMIAYIEKLENTLKEISQKDKLLLGLFSKDPMIVAESHKQLVALEVKPLQEKIEQDKPKVEYHDVVLHSSKLATITEIAKDLGMSAVKLNKILKDLHVQYKKGKCWCLYAEYENLVPSHFDYHITEYGQILKATELGRKWIIKLLEDKI